jgi:TRAP-type transport system periplasmic protein
VPTQIDRRSPPPLAYTRRGFLQAAVGTTGLILLSACTSAPASGPAATPKAEAKPAEAPKPAAPAVAKRETIQLKLGHGIAPTDPMHISLVEFAQNVNTRTEGAVKIDVFPNSQIGTDVQLYEQISLNAPLIVGVTDGWLANHVPDFGIFTAPFIWKSWDEAKKVYESDLTRELETQLQQKGGWVILTRNWPFGARHIANSKRVINTPDNLKGLKVRVPQIPMWVETFTALGATPVPLALPEIYPGLQQGLVDGVESPYSQHVSGKYYEVCKYLSLTGHFWQVNGIMGGPFYNSMPKDLQSVMVEEAKKSGDAYRVRQVATETDGAKVMQDNGVTITEVDKSPFQKATEVVYDVVGKEWTPGMVDKIRAIRDR